MRMRMLIAAMAALVMSAAGAASFNGVTYSESTTVPVGKWTCQFSKAKTYAYNHNIPLLVVWVNPGCGFCESFERNVMANSSVLSWMKSRGYVCVIAINGKTPGADLASDFIGAISQFPQCTVYWKPKSKTAIKYSFTGRRMTAAEYMALIDGKVGAYAGVTVKPTETKYALTLSASPSDGGRVSGGGSFLGGKKVSVSATAAKGYVFDGWYAGGELLSDKRSFTYTTTTAARTLTARFVTAEQDAARVSATLNGLAFSARNVQLATNVMCGVALEWPLIVNGPTTASYSVSNLPSGLRYVAKTGMISGVPTRAQSRTVKIVAKTTGGTKVTYLLDLAVEPLPTWATGTFNGGGEEGMVMLTVSSTGGISGKYMSKGTNWTLSAKSFSAWDARRRTLSAELTGKYGKLSFVERMAIGGDDDELWGRVSTERFDAYWNGWKSAALKPIAKLMDKATNLVVRTETPVSGSITLNFGSSGAVTAKGVFVIGQNERTGRDMTYSVSCSAAVIRFNDSDEFDIFIYYPPKKGKFDGLVDVIRVRWDGKNFIF